ncbi:hypothetical protein ACX3V1_23145 [Escherichia coli]
MIQSIFRETMPEPVSYTHLRAHETSQDLVCRLLRVKGGGPRLIIRPTIRVGPWSQTNNQTDDTSGTVVPV